MAERLVRASEIGEFAYCARAWWLARVLGRPRENLAQLAAGRARHEQHGQALSLSLVLQFLGLVLIMGSVIATVLLALTGAGR